MSLAGYNKITEKLPKNGFCEFIKRPAVVGVPPTACIVVVYVVSSPKKTLCRRLR